MTLTFCSFIKSLKIKKMIHKKTKQSSFIIYPLNLNESLKPPGETLMHVYPLESRLLHQTGISKLLPPSFQTLEQKIRHRKCYAFSCHKYTMIIWGFELFFRILKWRNIYQMIAHRLMTARFFSLLKSNTTKKTKMRRRFQWFILKPPVYFLYVVHLCYGFQSILPGNCFM